MLSQFLYFQDSINFQFETYKKIKFRLEMYIACLQFGDCLVAGTFQKRVFYGCFRCFFILRCLFYYVYFVANKS